ncbi:MAG: DUF4382 domain-containing protein [Deltaproteobacteria bacterium]|nr:DUF4382 domain-containing protein [Deltaproteobacteria bacterium]
MKKMSLLLSLWISSCGIGVDGTFIDLRPTAPLNSTEIGNTLTDPHMLNGSTFVFTKAKVVISEVEFELAENCNDSEQEVEYEYKQPFIVDLLANTSTPDFQHVEILPGNYCKVEFKLDKLEVDERPSGIGVTNEMIDLALLIEGSTSDNIEFRIEIEEDIELEIQSNVNTGFTIRENAINTLFLVLDIKEMLSDINFGSLTTTSGIVLIDKDENETAYEQIIEKLEQTTDLREDKNNDDELDENDDIIAD